MARLPPRAARNAATAPSPSMSSMSSASPPEWKSPASKIQILAVDLKRRATEWLSEHGPTFPGDPQTGLLGETDSRTRPLRRLRQPSAMSRPQSRHRPLRYLRMASHDLPRLWPARPHGSRHPGFHCPGPLRTMLYRRNHRRNCCLRNASSLRPRAEAPRRNPSPRRNHRSLRPDSLKSSIRQPLKRRSPAHSAGGAHGSTSTSKSNLRRFRMHSASAPIIVSLHPHG